LIGGHETRPFKHRKAFGFLNNLAPILTWPWIFGNDWKSAI